MKVRPAHMTDVPQLIELGKAIHAETRLAHLSYDDRKIHQSLHGLLSNQKGTHCLMLAISSNNEIVGVFLGYVAEYFFSRDRVATNILFYVKPAYRGSSAAIKLVSAFRQWSINRHVSELSINITSGVAIDRFDSFLRRLGFEHTGGNYSLWLAAAT